MITKWFVFCILSLMNAEMELTHKWDFSIFALVISIFGSLQPTSLFFLFCYIILHLTVFSQFAACPVLHALLYRGLPCDLRL